jgi:hypothetical protein
MAVRKKGELQLRISDRSTRVTARLLIDRSECTYSGDLKNLDDGMMNCPDRRSKGKGRKARKAARKPSEYYAAVWQDTEINKENMQRKLPMPVLGIPTVGLAFAQR